MITLQNLVFTGIRTNAYYSSAIQNALSLINDCPELVAWIQTAAASGLVIGVDPTLRDTSNTTVSPNGAISITLGSEVFSNTYSLVQILIHEFAHAYQPGGVLPLPSFSTVTTPTQFANYELSQEVVAIASGYLGFQQIASATHNASLVGVADLTAAQTSAISTYFSQPNAPAVTLSNLENYIATNFSNALLNEKVTLSNGATVTYLQDYYAYYVAHLMGLGVSNAVIANITLTNIQGSEWNTSNQWTATYNNPDTHLREVYYSATNRIGVYSENNRLIEWKSPYTRQTVSTTIPPPAHSVMVDTQNGDGSSQLSFADGYSVSSPNDPILDDSGLDPLPGSAVSSIEGTAISVTLSAGIGTFNALLGGACSIYLDSSLAGSVITLNFSQSTQELVVSDELGDAITLSNATELSALNLSLPSGQAVQISNLLGTGPTQVVYGGTAALELVGPTSGATVFFPAAGDTVSDPDDLGTLYLPFQLASVVGNPTTKSITFTGTNGQTVTVLNWFVPGSVPMQGGIVSQGGYYGTTTMSAATATAEALYQTATADGQTLTGFIGFGVNHLSAGTFSNVTLVGPPGNTNYFMPNGDNTTVTGYGLVNGPPSVGGSFNISGNVQLNLYHSNIPNLGIDAATISQSGGDMVLSWGSNGGQVVIQGGFAGSPVTVEDAGFLFDYAYSTDQLVETSYVRDALAAGATWPWSGLTFPNGDSYSVPLATSSLDGLPVYGDPTPIPLGNSPPFALEAQGLTTSFVAIGAGAQASSVTVAGVVQSQTISMSNGLTVNASFGGANGPAINFSTSSGSLGSFSASNKPALVTNPTDGSVTSASISAQGSLVLNTTYTNGTRLAIEPQSNGNVLSTQMSAAGVTTSSTITQPNGTKTTQYFGSDGTTVTSSTVIAPTAYGTTTTTQYASDGTTVTGKSVLHPDGTTIVTRPTANGGQSVSITDRAGDSATLTTNSNGILIAGTAELQQTLSSGATTYQISEQDPVTGLISTYTWSVNGSFTSVTANADGTQTTDTINSTGLTGTTTNGALAVTIESTSGSTTTAISPAGFTQIQQTNGSVITTAHTPSSTGLGAVSGTNETVTATNAAGAVAGVYYPGGSSVPEPFYQAPGSSTPINLTPSGYLGGAVYAMNASGQVAGVLTEANGTELAFRTSANGAITTVFGTANGVGSKAFAINDSGEVGGEIVLGNGTTGAFLSTSHGGLLIFGVGAVGDSAAVIAVNDQGDALVADTTTGAFYEYNGSTTSSVPNIAGSALWNGGTITQLIQNPDGSSTSTTTGTSAASIAVAHSAGSNGGIVTAVSDLHGDTATISTDASGNIIAASSSLGVGSAGYTAPWVDSQTGISYTATWSVDGFSLTPAKPTEPSICISTGSGGSVVASLFDAQANLYSAHLNSNGTLLTQTAALASGASSSWILNADNTSTAQSSDGQGDVTTTTRSAAGALISQSSTKANGSTYNLIVNPDDSSTSTSNDGQGTILTQNKNAAGALTSDSTSYGNGVVLAHTYNSDGSLITTVQDGNSDSAQILTDGSGNIVSASSSLGSNGGSSLNWTDAASGTSYQVSWSSAGFSFATTEPNTGLSISNSANGNYSAQIADSTQTVSTDFSSNSAPLSQKTVYPDGSSNTLTHNADGTSTATYVDASGDIFTETGSASNILLSQQSQYANGSDSTTTYNADGSSYTTTSDSKGDSSWAQESSTGVVTSQSTTTVGLNRSTTTVTDAPNETVTTVSLDGQGDSSTTTTIAGVTTSQAASYADGASTSAVLNSNGSKTVSWADGVGDSSSTTTLNGTQTSQYNTFAGGSTSSTVLNADGSTTANTSDGMGDSSVTTTLDGVQTSQYNEFADGSNNSTVLNADGSTTFVSTDGLGDSSSTQTNAAGGLITQSTTSGDTTTTVDYAADGATPTEQIVAVIGGNTTTDIYGTDGVSIVSSSTVVTATNVPVQSVNTVDGTTTTKNYVGGVLSQEIISVSGGTTTTTDYASDGLTPTQQVIQNGDSTTTALYAADGVTPVEQIVAIVGGNTTTTDYAANGTTVTAVQVVNQNVVTVQTVSVSGSTTTTENYTSVGVLAQQVVAISGGNTTTTNYAGDGVTITSSSITNAGEPVQTTSSVNGTTTVQNYTDGVLRQQVIQSSGTTTTTNYAADGITPTQQIVAVSGGNTTTTNYAANGTSVLSSQVVSTSGVTLQLVAVSGAATTTENYSTSGVLIQQIIKLSGGNTTTTNYAADGVTVASTQVSNANGVILQAVNVSGATTTTENFSNAGVLSQQIVAVSGGNTTTTDYAANGTSVSSVQILNAAGVLTSQLTEYTSGSVLQLYNTSGNLSSVAFTDSSGDTASINYDSAGTVTSVTQNMGGGGGFSWTDPVTGLSDSANWNTTQFSYASTLSGAVVQQILALRGGNTSVTNYASGGSVVSSSQLISASGITLQTVSNSRGVTTSYNYSSVGILTQQIVAIAGGTTSTTNYAANGTSVSSSTLVSATGVTLQTVNVSGSTTTTENYSSSGVLSQQIVSVAGGNTTTTNYGSNGTSVSSVLVVNAQGQFVSQLGYYSGGSISRAYSNGLLTTLSMADSSGDTATITFNPNGTVSAVAQHTGNGGGFSWTDPVTGAADSAAWTSSQFSYSSALAGVQTTTITQLHTGATSTIIDVQGAYSWTVLAPTGYPAGAYSTGVGGTGPGTPGAITSTYSSDGILLATVNSYNGGSVTQSYNANGTVSTLGLTDSSGDTATITFGSSGTVSAVAQHTGNGGGFAWTDPVTGAADSAAWTSSQFSYSSALAGVQTTTITQLHTGVVTTLVDVQGAYSWTVLAPTGYPAGAYSTGSGGTGPGTPGAITSTYSSAGILLATVNSYNGGSITQSYNANGAVSALGLTDSSGDTATITFSASGAVSAVAQHTGNGGGFTWTDPVTGAAGSAAWTSSQFSYSSALAGVQTTTITELHTGVVTTLVDAQGAYSWEILNPAGYPSGSYTIGSGGTGPGTAGSAATVYNSSGAVLATSQIFSSGDTLSTSTNLTTGTISTLITDSEGDTSSYSTSSNGVVSGISTYVKPGGSAASGSIGETDTQSGVSTIRTWFEDGEYAAASGPSGSQSTNTLYFGGTGTESYAFNTGSGASVLESAGSNPAGLDSVLINMTQATLSDVNGNLQIADGSGDTFTVEGWFSGSNQVNIQMGDSPYNKYTPSMINSHNLGSGGSLLVS